MNSFSIIWLDYWTNWKMKQDLRTQLEKFFAIDWILLKLSMEPPDIITSSKLSSSMSRQFSLKTNSQLSILYWIYFLRNFQFSTILGIFYHPTKKFWTLEKFFGKNILLLIFDKVLTPSRCVDLKKKEFVWPR